MIEAKVNFADALAGLEKLGAESRVSLARSMGVAAGQVFRDEAKLRAPVKTGLLRDSIYLAFRDGQSTDQRIVYSVSWNSTKAPHGHLVEFGHWQVVGGKRGKGGVEVGFTPAKPFLRPALDAAMGRARDAMLRRGRERLAELLSGGGGDDES